MTSPLNTFLKESRRNNLFVAQSLASLNLEVVNVGFQLAFALQGKLQSKHLPLIAEEKLHSILKEGIRQSVTYSQYLAIRNLGILFEPEFSLNPVRILQGYSQNNILFVEWPGEIEGDQLFFLTRQNGKEISLKETSYLTI